MPINHKEIHNLLWVVPNRAMWWHGDVGTSVAGQRGAAAHHTKTSFQTGDLSMERASSMSAWNTALDQTNLAPLSAAVMPMPRDHARMT